MRRSHRAISSGCMTLAILSASLGMLTAGRSVMAQAGLNAQKADECYLCWDPFDCTAIADGGAPPFCPAGTCGNVDATCLPFVDNTTNNHYCECIGG